MASRTSVVLGVLVAACLVVPPAAHAQFDHLKCYKVKDKGLAKAKYSADLVPRQTGTFPLEQGCVISVPAKMLCIDVNKTNVTPNPPGAPAGTAAQNYLCYKMKCPKSTISDIPVSDQFGSRLISVKKPGLLCAPAQGPASPSGAFLDGAGGSVF
jgi:hypothetical protein